MAERFATSRLVAKSQTNVNAGHVSEGPDHAGLGVRIVAYFIDSLVLVGFTSLFVAAAGVNVYLRSESGRENPSDAAIWDSVAILMATVPAWLLLNLLLDLRRGQSIGQYMLGLRVARGDGGEPGTARHLLHWLALHPLLFHPLLAGFWLLFAYVSISLSGSELLFVGSVTVALLCLLAPLACFFFALRDSQRRGLHDWIAGTKVVSIE